MTTFEKFRLESFNSHAISEGKIKKGIGAVSGLMASHGQGVTFADSLYSITAQNVDAWTSEDEEEVQKTAVVDRICKTPMEKLLYYARERWTDDDLCAPNRSAEDAIDGMPTLREKTILDTDNARNMSGDMPPQAVSIYYHGDPETGKGAGYIPFTDGAGNVINNIINSAVNNIIINGDMPTGSLLNAAPDKWVTEPGISLNAAKAAREFRRKAGFEDAEPTYELTPEQREWLNSRHDFSTMRRYVGSSFEYGGTTQYRTEATAEYSNFVADLVYLGVISYDDLIPVIPLDTRPGANDSILGYLNKVQASDGSVLSAARLLAEHLQNMFDFYSERSMDGDAEFAALIKEHYLPSQKLFLKLIEELFGSKEELPKNSIAPPIEDASEKLKEDFGSRM